jgi:hypothetical protein
MELMELEDFKYNTANITAFRLVKTNSSFFKEISSNLTDYYSISDKKLKNILINVKFINHIRTFLFNIHHFKDGKCLII